MRKGGGGAHNSVRHTSELTPATHPPTHAVFNLTIDPWEREDVAAQYPEIVAELTARLAQWGVGARDPYYRTARVDPRSNPAGRGNAWFPWID